MPPHYSGVTLYKFLRENNLPHDLIHRLAKKKKIKVDASRPSSVKTPLQQGQMIYIRHPNLVSDVSGSAFEKTPVNGKDAGLIREWIIYRDDHIIAINKPCRIAVQGGTKTDVHVNAMLSGLQYDLPEPPRLLHRIDKCTSGILLLARTRSAAMTLSQAFKQSSGSYLMNENPLVEKTYIAVVSPALPITRPNQWLELSAPLKLENEEGVEKVGISISGRATLSQYQIVGASPSLNLSLLKVQPITGHKHQIRSHLSNILGSPIVNDFKYGYKSAAARFDINEPSISNQRGGRPWMNAKKPMFLHLHQIRIKSYNTMMQSDFRVMMSRMANQIKPDNIERRKPDADNDGDLIISAPLPSYFQNLIQNKQFMGSSYQIE